MKTLKQLIEESKQKHKEMPTYYFHNYFKKFFIPELEEIEKEYARNSINNQ